VVGPALKLMSLSEVCHFKEADLDYHVYTSEPSAIARLCVSKI